MELKKTRHSNYKIAYHLVWCTKFRKEVLYGKVEVTLKNILAQICRVYRWELMELEIMPDHVHLLVSAPPTTAPVDIAKTLKSISAVELFATYPKLKKQKFWGSGMWSPSTYYGTVGSADERAVSKYIQHQKRPSAR